MSPSLEVIFRVLYDRAICVPRVRWLSLRWKPPGRGQLAGPGRPSGRSRPKAGRWLNRATPDGSHKITCTEPRGTSRAYGDWASRLTSMAGAAEPGRVHRDARQQAKPRSDTAEHGTT